MKAKLEFDLPEDKDDFTLAVNGLGLYCVLHDMCKYLRSLEDKDFNDAEYEIIISISDKLFEFMEDHNINLDMVS